jgi:transcriptional regulator with XRE-family HTH domain
MAKLNDPQARLRRPWRNTDPSMLALDGLRIRVLRTGKRLRQLDVAREMQLSQTTIGQIELGDLVVNQYLAEQFARVLLGDPRRWRELLAANQQDERSA